MILGPMAAQAQYDFMQISYPGDATQVFGINDSGDAVGNGFNLDSIPFVYASMDGTLTDIAPADGYASTGVIGINDAGVLVGSVTNLDLTTISGFIRSKDGTYSIFSHPDAASLTEARGVNNRGLVTGFFDTDDATYGSIATGFIYDPKTETFTDIVPSLFTIAHGINSKGTVVGSAIFEVDPCGGPNGGFSRYGWVRSKHGLVTFFQVNEQRTAARGINDAGMIVGQTADPLTLELKGFAIKTPETSCESVAVDASELLQFPNSSNTFPEGVTNSGDIVGNWVDASDQFQGFIATPQ